MIRFGLWGVLLCVILTSCSPKQTVSIPEEQASTANGEVVRADAYLFDCKLKRDGKINSFRLELFVTDSIAGFSGRGYLGKGVLQGVLRRDSLFALFPTTHEYVTEDIKSLLKLSECASDFSDTVVLAMLQPILKLPLEDVLAGYLEKKDSRVEIELNDFTLSPISDSCPMKLSVAYKKKNNVWRPNKLEFFDGKVTRLTATCREVREQAKIPRRRFQFTIPDNGTRISP